jgi:hypothetical protein
MAALKLSTGIAIQSEHIQKVEYFPGGSLFISCEFTPLADQHFLYIRTVTGTVRVTGRGAAQDAETIEQAGVRVYRRRMPALCDANPSLQGAAERHSIELNRRLAGPDTAKQPGSAL